MDIGTGIAIFGVWLAVGIAHFNYKNNGALVLVAHILTATFLIYEVTQRTV